MNKFEDVRQYQHHHQQVMAGAAGSALANATDVTGFLNVPVVPRDVPRFPHVAAYCPEHLDTHPQGMQRAPGRHAGI